MTLIQTLGFISYDHYWMSNQKTLTNQNNVKG